MACNWRNYEYLAYRFIGNTGHPDAAYSIAAYSHLADLVSDLSLCYCDRGLMPAHLAYQGYYCQDRR